MEVVSPQTHRKNQKGVALIVVLSLVTVLVTLMSDLLFQSEITSRESQGEFNRLQAEISAVTGAQLAKLLLNLHMQIDGMTQELSKPDSATLKNIPENMRGMVQAQVSGIKTMLREQLGGKEIFEILNGLPIGKEGLDTLKDLAKIDIGAFDKGLENALKSIPGYFIIKTSSENAKFNLNSLSREFRNHGRAALLRILSGDKEKKLLEQKKLRSEDLVDYVTDYVSSSVERDKTMPYDLFKFTHKSKNAPLESLEELRRIPGFHDDDLYSVFSPYFTVWPMDVPKEFIDVNRAPIELLSAIFTKEGQQVKDEVWDKIEDMRSSGQQILDTRDKSKYIPLADDPAGKDILSLLTGIESTVFKVEVQGFFQGIHRTYVSVISLKDKRESKMRTLYQRLY